MGKEKYNNINKDLLYTEYWVNNKSLTQIAKEYELFNIKYIFKKLNIPVRPRGEMVSIVTKRRVHKIDCQCTTCKAKRGEYYGSNAPNYKDGCCTDHKPICIVEGCNIIVAKKGNRCRIHGREESRLKKIGKNRPDQSLRMTGKNHWNYKDGRSSDNKPTFYCKYGCGKVVSKEGNGCQSCAKKGERNPTKQQGYTPWNKNISCKEETKRKISEAKKGKLKVKREIRFCECKCGRSFECKVNSKRRYIKGHHMIGKIPKNKNKKLTIEERLRVSILTKKAMARPEVRAKIEPTMFTFERFKQMLKEGKYNIHPNKPETVILNLLNTLFPNNYKYTGDFSFWIESFNPDFINTNGQKKIIEMFGTYWHKNTQERDKKRLETYKKYGYDTLIIWEHELKNIDKVKDSIEEFHYD